MIHGMISQLRLSARLSHCLRCNQIQSDYLVIRALFHLVFVVYELLARDFREIYVVWHHFFGRFYSFHVFDTSSLFRAIFLLFFAHYDLAVSLFLLYLFSKLTDSLTNLSLVFGLDLLDFPHQRDLIIGFFLQTAGFSQEATLPLFFLFHYAVYLVEDIHEVPAADLIRPWVHPLPYQTRCRRLVPSQHITDKSTLTLLIPRFIVKSLR